MSFLTHNKNPHKRIKTKHGKETKDSLMANHFSHINKKERASAFTSKGSITLEASIVVPLFFFAMICLAYLLEMMAVRTSMQNGLYSAAREVAQQAYVSTTISTGQVEQLIKNQIEDDLEDSVDCSDSVVNHSTGVIDLSVKYEVEIPILMFRISPISLEETLRVKGWTGYASGAEELTEETVVYVTETGLVYHAEPTCTYLDMSVRSVGKTEVKNLRNKSGAKYYACESCGKKESESLYITDYGTRYHSSLECKKIKRNVYAVSIDDIYGLGGCSKCVE